MRRERLRVPLSAQPYRRSQLSSIRSMFLVFMLLVVMVCAVVVITATQARFSWLWVVPFLVTAAAIYSYRRERTATNMLAGTLWTLAQVVGTLGACASIALPAKF